MNTESQKCLLPIDSPILSKDRKVYGVIYLNVPLPRSSEN